MFDATHARNNILISVNELCFSYPDSRRPALDHVSLCVKRGEHLALCGANGSGKTTLGRCIIGLCKPDPSTIVVDGNLDPADPSSLFAIRQKIGMVFQSPQDQLVASIVEEEVAFGLENLGLPSQEMEARITEVLEQLGLSAVRTRPCRFLSAGQQQRLAIASVLAMRPQCIIFDEATAMIDPHGRASILSIMDELNARGFTIIHITHDMEEAARARRVVVINGGRLVFDGSPQKLFVLPCLESWRLCLPHTISRAAAVSAHATTGETVETVGSRDTGEARETVETLEVHSSESTVNPVPKAFVFNDVSFTYLKNTVFAVTGLKNISLEIPRGAIIALIGATGSGKSTALQLMNLILYPESGFVEIFGHSTKGKKISPRAIRLRCPLSIQMPERAIFENFAADEVAYGPRMQGLKGKVLVERVKSAMNLVGLPYGEYRDRNPRKLSGGERRKLALASVIAMDADAYLFDEPTASLDPCSVREIMNIILKLVQMGKTVVFATHNMHYADVADTVFYFEQGQIVSAACAQRAGKTPLLPPISGSQKKNQASFCLCREQYEKH